jgi:hypothetical protein
MQSSLLALLCASISLPAQVIPPPAEFITSHDARLWEGDHEYRAIGVNIPHLSQIYLGTWLHLEQLHGNKENAKAAALDALDDAAQSGFAFVRFFAGPGYPIESARLYESDPDAYWRGMDQLIGECAQRGLRVVPCLQVTLHHSRNAEPRSAILDPNSKTWKANRRYVEAFVTRHRDNPAILLWELENELLLAADVDMTGVPLWPKGVYPEGATVRETGERADSLTWAQIQQIDRDQAAFIKSLDTHHLVTSGDAGVRPEATSRRLTFPDFVYRDDTWREHLANEVGSQPEPLDVFSLHHYGPADTGPQGSGLSVLDRYRLTARAIAAARVPLFIGELGQLTPSYPSDPDARWTRDYIDMADQEGISLIALWVWHFPWQTDLTLDGRSHAALIDRVRAFNRGLDRSK